MILADTSIWVDHLGRGDTKMVSLLNAGVVLIHPFVIGETALGNLPRRNDTLLSLGKLPKAVLADPVEVLHFLDRHQIFGSGVGYVDAHLLVATFLTSEARLWTRDKKLRAVAEKLAVAATELN